MRAVQIGKYGGSGVIEVRDGVSTPSPKKGQLLVEVHAASLNPVDWKVRAGYLQQMAPLSFPATLGGDFSGVVTQVGEGVSGFKAGDEAYGQAIALNGGSGSLAEYAAANAANTSPKPLKVNHVEAAALPLAGVSALQALEEHLKLESGQKILVHGGAGGIGAFAIQLAKHLGAFVATTVSSGNMEFAKQLGADEVIDYKSESFETLLQGYDAVLDTVGGETYSNSFKVLKKGGAIVSMLEKPREELAQQYGVKAIVQGTDTNSLRLARLAELVDAGAVKVHVDKEFPLAQAREAFQLLEKGSYRGKIVVKIS